MALKRIVKVGNITNLSDARYCSGMGVDMLGFSVIEGQENYLPAATYQEIKGWFEGPKVVAELYGMSDGAGLEKILEDYQPDLVEVSAKELACLPADFSIPLIYNTGSVFNNEVPNVAFLITTADTIETKIPVLTPCKNEDELEKIVSNPAIKGIVLKGSSEEKPGQQDYDHLADILEALEVD